VGTNIITSSEPSRSRMFVTTGNKNRC
jgi:hypothetical protein